MARSRWSRVERAVKDARMQWRWRVKAPTRGAHPDGDLLFLQELTRAAVAGDVVEVAGGMWAIHGDIPVDRDVIMAEFATYDEARIALDVFFHRKAGSPLT